MTRPLIMPQRVSPSAAAGDAITFKVRTRTIEYGDRRKFVEYRILFCHRGRVVGAEDGPRRTTPDRAGARKAARARIAVLRTRRLYAIAVTRKHITDGEARNCNTCAISQALWHNQERMGFPKREFSFRIEPYGFMSNVRGITLSRIYGDIERALPVDELPDLVWTVRDRTSPIYALRSPNSCGGEKVYPESMVEWAMRFDDWAESRFMSLKEWRDKHSAEPDERPCRPGPVSFVLDLDAFSPVSE